MSETSTSSATHSVASQRCFNHHQREAAAVCLECSRTFCRECVTEHDDRVICASCLPSIASGDPRRSTSLRHLLLALQGLLGFALLWLTFFALGQMLLQMPTEFHDGTDPTESASL
jgi:hypothetical protein